MEIAGKSLRALRRRLAALLAGAAAVGLCAAAGCMTPDKAVREADAAGVRLATEYWQRQSGSTNGFDVCRAADALTLRIALLAAARGEQGVVFPQVPGVEAGVSNAVYTLALVDALRVAARNDRKYQKLKEEVFFRALDVDDQAYAFETSFSGLLLAALSGGSGADQARLFGEAGAERTLPDGKAIAGRLALDVVSLLRDDWRSSVLSGDLTVTVPLLRGSGREIVREPLTQAERNLGYALRAFAYYRQTYTVTVASAYYRVLEAYQRLSNASENERRLSLNFKRAEMMFDAGRMQRIQVDQARSDLLKAGDSVISARKSFESQLDAFKVTMGLPPEARLALAQGELRELEERMEKLAQAGGSATDDFPDEAESFRVALGARQDLSVVRGQLEDAERSVRIAADALRPDAALTGTLSSDRSRETGGGSLTDERWAGNVKVGFPWDRRKERNAFKKRLVAFEQAKRALEEQEDGVKLAVRNGLRNLVAARASYENQVKSLEVARLRVESNDLFLQSGRSTMRDILEAESAMLTARNAFCSAVITWRVSELELRRDLGVLEVTDQGALRQSGGRHD